MWVRLARGKDVDVLISAGAMADGLEGEVGRFAMSFFPPLLKEPAIAEGDVLFCGDAESGGGAVDPGWRSFEFSVVANGGFVDDAVPFPVAPLAAPFLVTKGADQAQGEEDLFERGTIGDFGFGFDAVLVGVESGAVVGKAFVGYGPTACVAADAQNFGASAHLAVGGVVEHVTLEAARGEKRESCRGEPMSKTRQVVDFELDLSLNRHGR